MTRPPRRANFDRVARLYRWAEYLLLGPVLMRVRLSLLTHLPAPSYAVVLGDGDGRFLAALLRTFPHLQALAIDSSATMLHLLQRRCAFASERLRIQHTDVTTWKDGAADLQRADLIVTHFFLDCLAQDGMVELATRLGTQVQPGTRWLLSDFAYPPHQPWRLLGTVYIHGLYAVFRLLTGLPVRRLPEIPGALLQAGFTRQRHRSFLGGLLFSAIWKADSDLAHDIAMERPLLPHAQLRSMPCHPPVCE